MKFGSDEIKKTLDVNDVDIKNILVSTEFARDKNKKGIEKYFIEYKTGKSFRPLFITPPHISGCLRKYKINHYMFFELKDEKMLQKYK